MNVDLDTNLKKELGKHRFHSLCAGCALADFYAQMPNICLPFPTAVFLTSGGGKKNKQKPKEFVFVVLSPPTWSFFALCFVKL